MMRPPGWLVSRFHCFQVDPATPVRSPELQGALPVLITIAVKKPQPNLHRTVKQLTLLVT
jgi:hypothetical protein